MTQTPDEQAAIEQAQAFVAARLQRGMGKRAVAKELVQQGWPPDIAKGLVAEVASAIRALGGGRGAIVDAVGDMVEDSAETPVARATGDFVIGVAAIAVAGLITLGTYLAAPPGATYFIVFGPALYGLYRILRGVTRLSGGEQ